MNDQPYYYNPFQPNGQFNQQNTVFMLQQEALMEKKNIRKISNAVGLAIIAFVFIQATLGSAFTTIGKILNIDMNNPSFEYGMYIFLSVFSVLVPFVIVASALNVKSDEVVPNKHIDKIDLFWYVCLGSGLCMVSNIITSFIVTLFSSAGLELSQPETSEPNSIFSSLLYFIAIAIIPPITEEIAMRGVTMHSMLKHGKVFAIVTSALVFGVLHGNLIQAPFAFMVGLVLGFITVRTNNILPAMIIHFCNNGLSAFIAILRNYVSESTSTIVYYVFFIGWIALAIVGIIVLANRNWGTKKEETVLNDIKYTNPYALSTGKKVGTFIFTIPMLVSLFILVVLTLTTISKG